MDEEVNEKPEALNQQFQGFKEPLSKELKQVPTASTKEAESHTFINIQQFPPSRLSRYLVEFPVSSKSLPFEIRGTNRPEDDFEKQALSNSGSIKNVKNQPGSFVDLTPRNSVEYVVDRSYLPKCGSFNPYGNEQMECPRCGSPNGCICTPIETWLNTLSGIPKGDLVNNYAKILQDKGYPMLIDLVEATPTEQNLKDWGIVLEKHQVAIMNGFRRYLKTENMDVESQKVVTTKKRKLDLSEKDNFTFRYGVQDFAEVSRGFYVDKTQYITHLEASKSQVFVFFRPRRFGKSLFLSTLSYFYDVFRRDDFEPLFKDLSVYSDPKLNTYKKNECFVMHWSFSALDTSHGVEEFDRSLTREVKSAIRSLLDKYSYLVILQH